METVGRPFESDHGVYAACSSVGRAAVYILLRSFLRFSLFGYFTRKGQTFTGSQEVRNEALVFGYPLP